MSGKTLAALSTFVIIAWCIVMLALVSAGWEAVTSEASWGPVGVLFIPALVLFIIGQALASAAKRRGVNAATWEPRQESQVTRSGELTKAHFFMSALRQMLLEDPGATAMDARSITVADGFLATYHQSPEADWPTLWREASTKRDLPGYGESPYWAHIGPGGRPVPLSYLAFWDTGDRMRAVCDEQTAPEILALAVDDPDRMVARAAARRI